MFNGSPTFVRFRSASQRIGSSPWWFIMAPGLTLIALALAILIWPQLLAYMVAFALLFAGASLTMWGWTMRRAEKIHRRQSQENTVYYEVR